MHLKLLIVAFAAAVLAAAPARAAAACCDQHHKTEGARTIVEMMMTTDPQLTTAPARQAVEVWFKRPVLVGKSMLLGHYVIEHDNDRMARGEPCTHIYAYNDRTRPVATFNCTHLERERAGENMVILYTMSDGRLQRLGEFQFAGETAAHGYPTGR